MRNFVTVHCHQGSLDTASTPEAFAEKELELGTGYLTVTDHGTLAQARKVYDLAKKKKLTPVIGLEAYLRDDNCPILTAAGVEKSFRFVNERGEFVSEEKYLKLSDREKADYQKEYGFWDYLKYMHVTMHAMDADAYETMVRLLSKADNRAERHGSERKPLFTWRDLEELGAENVTMTSSCLVGAVQRHIMEHGKTDMAEAYFARLKGICKPGNFYAEVFPHRCDHNWEPSRCFVTYADGTAERFHLSKKLKVGKFEGDAKELAKDPKNWTGLPLVSVMERRKWQDREPKVIAEVSISQEGFVKNECTPWAEDGDVQRGTNQAVLYLAEKFDVPVVIGDDSHYAHPEEKAVQDVRLASMGSWRFYGHYHRQSSSESFQHFKDTLGTSEQEFESWVDNSYAWASKFKDFSFKERKSIPSSFYPEDTFGHIMTLIDKHGRMRWDNKVWVDRLEAEVKMLYDNGTIDLLPYMMTGEEVCNFYAKLGLLTGPGRGSAAGLLLAYVLRITHVKPLKYELSMERFLTPSRIRSGKLPDIDMDFPDRAPLIGQEEQVLSVEMEDGSIKVVGKNTKVWTREGIVTVDEAHRKQLDVVEWLEEA